MANSIQKTMRFCLMACAGSLALVSSSVRAGEPVVASGQDIVVTAIPGVINYDSETPPGSPQPIDAFAIGTICCNAGDETLPFDGSGNQHAILRQGMFRLKAGRFEQIGTSWIKHVYPASNEPGTCGLTCVNPNTSGLELRPGCTDSNSAGLNGDRVHTTRSYEIDPFTATFPYPGGITHAEGPIEQRIQVNHSDLNPATNQGATYFVEAQYLHPGDAADGNADNNATFARVTLSDPGTGTYVMTITSPALNRGQMKPAILAWQEADSSVTVTQVRVPNEGLFFVAAKATSVGGGFWHYEYAIENLNSDRAGGSFRVPLPGGALVQNVGFHDVNYHSGEPQSGTNWAVVPLEDAVAWTTQSYDVNPASNALRWSTLYNFRFDANVGPSPTTATLGLFKPGMPSQVEFETIGPALGFMDCNGNERLDACDVNCAAGTCPAPCGQSGDCNGNGLPDECETDCNSNGEPDDCDVVSVSEDCNNNSVPDECEPDCDEDSIPDECEAVLDADLDGVVDCADACPTTTPPGYCLPAEYVTCRFSNGSCVENYPRSACLAIGGSPICPEPGFCDPVPCVDSSCRDGCLPGDYDGDADRDLRDIARLMTCFTAWMLTGNEACVRAFDLDDDNDIDLIDAGTLQAEWQGPQ